MSTSQSPASGTAAEPAETGWAERGIGQDWQHRSFHLLIRIVGKRPAYHLAYVVTFIYALFYPAIRRRCSFYLARRFPGHRGAIRRFLDTHRLLRNFARTLVDMAAFRILGRSSLAADCPNRDRLLKLVEGDKGFVLVIAHVGGWQLGLLALGNLHRPVSLVMVPDPKLDGLVRATDVKTIDPRTGLQGVLQMMQALQQGEVVGLMGDRSFGDEHYTVEVPLLGGPAALPVSPYRLASAAGVPVAVLMAAKTGYRSYQLRVMRIIEVPPGLGRDAKKYAAYARQFAEALEEFVEEYPWQFFNFYDLWSPAAQAAATPPTTGDS